MDTVPLAAEVLLVGVCLLVSLVSPSLGTSGGVTFAVMATVMPPQAVVPVHALTESMASAIRWSLLRPYVNYRYVLPFAGGCALGLGCAWPMIGNLGDRQLLTLLGCFFLLSTWLPVALLRVSSLVAGVTTSALSIIVGATGPLVASLIARDEADHRAVIATQGACTTFQHAGKAILFALWGFSFADHAGLILALAIATVVGTWFGKRLLLRLPQARLKLALKLLVTALGVQLIVQGQGLHLPTIAPTLAWWVSSSFATLMLGGVLGYRMAGRRLSL